MFDLDLEKIKRDQTALTNEAEGMVDQKINGVSIKDYIFNKIITKADPIQYCQRVLRAHLPEKKQKLHENQVELIRAVCNPKIRKVTALMARQAGK